MGVRISVSQSVLMSCCLLALLGTAQKSFMFSDGSQWRGSGQGLLALVTAHCS